MTHVLFITPYTPAPIRVRPYELLRALVAQRLRITLLCPAAPDDQAAIDELRNLGIGVRPVAVTSAQRGAAMARGAIGGLPLQAAYGLPAPLGRALRDLLARESFDLAHVEHVRAAGLMPLLGDLPVVYDSVDCISLLLDRTRRGSPAWRSRAIAAIEYGRTQRFERRVCERADTTIVTSADDAAALHTLAPDAPIQIVPNGVDLDRFAPPDLPRADNVIVMTGKMSYHANVAAALRLIDEIMPRVWRQHPSAQAWVVGSDPPRSITRRSGDPRIVVTGRVPEIAPYLQQSTIAVSPLRYGVGVQNKVLEAMATATPTIVDRQCLRALQTQPDRDLLVAGDDDSFATAIIDLLDDADRRKRIGDAARAYVEHAHRWANSAALLAQVYQHTLHAHPRRAGFTMTQATNVTP